MPNRNKVSVPGLLTFLALSAPSFADAQEPDPMCADFVEPAEVARLLALPQGEFDQDPSGGWRPMADEGCYIEAAEVIDLYAETRYSDPGEPGLEILRFHAGQLYAFASQAELAVRRFLESYQPQAQIDEVREQGNEPVAVGLEAWNAYVDATIGFLTGDLARVEKARAIVAKGPTMPDGTVANLAIVDRFIQGLGRPYAEVYRGTERP